MVHENNELRHKVVYIGSRCEQVESELIQTKEYLNSEVKKANERTDQAKKEKVIITISHMSLVYLFHLVLLWFSGFLGPQLRKILQKYC